MLKNANAQPNDVEGFTDFVRSIKGVEVAFMILEQKYDIRIKILRHVVISVSRMCRY